MSDEMLGGTNFWRGVRGEAALSVEGIIGRLGRIGEEEAGVVEVYE